MAEAGPTHHRGPIGYLRVIQVAAVVPFSNKGCETHQQGPCGQDRPRVLWRFQVMDIPHMPMDYRDMRPILSTALEGAPEGAPEHRQMASAQMASSRPPQIQVQEAAALPRTINSQEFHL